MRKNNAVVFGLLLFPVMIALLSMAGFLFDVTINRLYAFLSLIASLIGTWFVASEEKKSCVLWVCGIIIASIVIAGLPVMYAIADSDNYHRPATILLINGWNPLRIRDLESIAKLMGGGFADWHTAFLPRLMWIYGASLYKWFGFVEVADSLNVLMFFAAFITVRTWLRDRIRICNRYLNLLINLAICCAPVVVHGVCSGTFCGTVDSAMYTSFLIAVIAADTKNLPCMVLAIVVMTGLKFTGCVIGVLIFAVYMIFNLCEWKRYLVSGLLWNKRLL